MAGRCDPPAFLPVRPITQVHLAAVTERARRRVIRWFKRRGFLDTAAAVELTPFEFLDRLADLVPPPRKHRHRYHGGFAPNHKLRPAERLGRGRAGPRRPDNLSGVARRAARDRHPQALSVRAGHLMFRRCHPPERIAEARAGYLGGVRGFAIRLRLGLPDSSSRRPSFVAGTLLSGSAAPSSGWPVWIAASRSCTRAA